MTRHHIALGASGARTHYIERIADAADEDEVVRTVQDYLRIWPPQSLAQIPVSCRPGQVTDATDIGECAYELTRARIDGLGAEPYLVEMEGFFARACARLSELEAKARRLGDNRFART